MRSDEILLRKLIREELSADWGEYAFAEPQRPGVPFEANTPEEKRAMRSLVNWIRTVEAGGPLNIPREVVENIRSVLDSGKYPDMIRPPDSPLVYRGLTLSMLELGKMGVDDKVLSSKSPSWVEVGGNFRHSALAKGVTSWTTDKRVAQMFALNHVMSALDHLDGGASVNDQVFGAVLVASTSANRGKLLDIAPIYSLSRNHAAKFEYEKEVVGLDEIVSDRMFILDGRVAKIFNYRDDPEVMIKGYDFDNLKKMKGFKFPKVRDEEESFDEVTYKRNDSINRLRRLMNGTVDHYVAGQGLDLGEALVRLRSDVMRLMDVKDEPSEPLR